MEHRYDVALSFAGEDRPCADALTRALKQRGVRVFYDMDEQADLWGKDLYVHFSRLYRELAHFCIMFLSAQYANKPWTKHERQAAFARAFEEDREYILPIRLDDTEIPGIPPTIGHLDWRAMPVDAIADAVASKLATLLGGRVARPAPPQVQPQPSPPAQPTLGFALAPMGPAESVATATWDWEAISAISRIIFFLLESIGSAYLGWLLLVELLGQFHLTIPADAWTIPALGITGFLWGIAYFAERTTNREDWERALSPFFPLHYIALMLDLRSIRGILRWLLITPPINVTSSGALAYGLAQAAVIYAHAQFIPIFSLVFIVSTVASLIAFGQRHQLLGYP